MGRNKAKLKQRKLILRADDKDWLLIKDSLPKDTCARAALIMSFIHKSSKRK